MERKKKLIIELTEEETTAYYDFLDKTWEEFRRRTTPEELEEFCEVFGSRAVTVSTMFTEFGAMIKVQYLEEEEALRNPFAFRAKPPRDFN